MHSQTWDYLIQAANVIGLSAWSNTVDATLVPLTPKDFRATNIGRTARTLNWNDVSANETGCQTQRRRVGANNWISVVTMAANATSYRDINRSPKTQCDYRIRGVNGVGSPWMIIRVRTLPYGRTRPTGPISLCAECTCGRPADGPAVTLRAARCSGRDGARNSGLRPNRLWHAGPRGPTGYFAEAPALASRPGLPLSCGAVRKKLTTHMANMMTSVATQ
jgi:hypothetical protein